MSIADSVTHPDCRPIKILSGDLYYSIVTQKKGRIEIKCF